MASKKSSVKISSLVFVSLMIVALIVGVVGLFLNFAVWHNDIKDVAIKLFDLESTAGIFTIIFAIVGLVCAALLIGVTLYTVITNKNAKLLNLILIIVTLAVAVAFIICATTSCVDLTTKVMEAAKQKYVLSAGAYLLFFGTILVPFFGVANKLVK